MNTSDPNNNDSKQSTGSDAIDAVDGSDPQALAVRASDSNQPLTRLDAYIVKLAHLISLIFLLSACIIVFEIGARYLFNSPTIWVHETTTLFCAMCFIYAGSYCLASNRHIRIGIVYDAVSDKVRRWLDLVISFAGLIYVVILTWAAYLVAEKALFAPWGEFRMETSGSAWDPALPAIVKAFLFLVLMLMSIQFFLHFVHHIMKTSGKDYHV
ncbi:MAG: TRAP transporter small permease [Amphritea sp.]